MIHRALFGVEVQNRFPVGIESLHAESVAAFGDRRTDGRHEPGLVCAVMVVRFPGVAQGTPAIVTSTGSSGGGFLGSNQSPAMRSSIETELGGATVPRYSAATVPGLARVDSCPSAPMLAQHSSIRAVVGTSIVTVSLIAPLPCRNSTEDKVRASVAAFQLD